jgi:ParB family chromosome partitioning protein
MACCPSAVRLSAAGNQAVGRPMTTAPILILIPLAQLHPHPDNPRLFERADVVAQSAVQIERGGGFDPAYALLVRPINDGFQIVAGHHRVAAARAAGLETVPCWVREMDDDEAFMALVLANSQSELLPLERGMQMLASRAIKRSARNQ